MSSDSKKEKTDSTDDPGDASCSEVRFRAAALRDERDSLARFFIRIIFWDIGFAMLQFCLRELTTM